MKLKNVYYLRESTNADVVITEIGGTTGDIESLPFIEAIRQIRSDLGRNVMYVHCTLLPYIKAAGEMRSQHNIVLKITRLRHSTRLNRCKN